MAATATSADKPSTVSIRQDGSLPKSSLNAFLRLVSVLHDIAKSAHSPAHETGVSSCATNE